MGRIRDRIRSYLPEDEQEIVVSKKLSNGDGIVISEYIKQYGYTHPWSGTHLDSTWSCPQCKSNGPDGKNTLRVLIVEGTGDDRKGVCRECQWRGDYEEFRHKIPINDKWLERNVELIKKIQPR